MLIAHLYPFVMLVSMIVKKIGPNENAVMTPKNIPLYMSSKTGCMNVGCLLQ
jgi:hypothetical protein